MFLLCMFISILYAVYFYIIHTAFLQIYYVCVFYLIYTLPKPFWMLPFMLQIQQNNFGCCHL